MESETKLEESITSAETESNREFPSQKMKTSSDWICLHLLNCDRLTHVLDLIGFFSICQSIMRLLTLLI